MRGFIKILISTAKSTPAAAEQKMCAARKLFCATRRVTNERTSRTRTNVDAQAIKLAGHTFRQSWHCDGVCQAA